MLKIKNTFKINIKSDNLKTKIKTKRLKYKLK